MLVTLDSLVIYTTQLVLSRNMDSVALNTNKLWNLSHSHSLTQLISMKTSISFFLVVTVRKITPNIAQIGFVETLWVLDLLDNPSFPIHDLLCSEW